jgi:Autotransporter beta-domain
MNILFIFDRQMKTAFLFTALAIGTFSPVWAISQNCVTEAQRATNPNNPTNISNNLAVGRVVDSVISISGAKAAGVTTDAKAVSQTSVIGTTSEWFKNPAVFLNYGYTQQDDKRAAGVGYDGGIHSVQLGMDFATVEDIIVGAVYTSVLTDISSRIPNLANQYIEGESHNINLYASKTFGDWFLAGATVGFGKGQLKNKGLNGRDFNPAVNTDTLSVAPFVGAFHTYGAWSFATVPTLLMQTSTVQNEVGGNPFGTGVGNPPDISSSTLIWKNKVEYAVTDQLILGLKADYNQLLSQYGLPPTTPAFRVDDNWIAFGPKIVWSPVEKWQVDVAYEHDLFNQTYDNHRINVGATYMF